jgi:hypothetical protein
MVVVTDAAFQTMTSVLFVVFDRWIVIGLVIFVGLSILLSIAMFALMIIRPRISA